MTLASKPPIRRKTSTGMTTAISASDWPRLRAGRSESPLMSVALWLNPDIRNRRRPQRPQGCEEPRFPGVGVVDRDADEVAGAVPHVAARRGPRRGVQRGAGQPVLFCLGGRLGEGSGPLLVEPVDVQPRDREELGSTAGNAEPPDQP